ncbi:MAG: peptide chain release factor N(5)-glutamine methyltransferase [Acidobacteria bacterium]|nr:peptide chain release factor N(5)-glutamine methyltransferase [Acidobacteriota bacterium]
MNLQTALRQGAELLERGAIPAPRLTAEVLLCHALDRERVYLYAHPEEEISERAWARYGRSLDERLGGKPTQYITGRQEFYGREFRVGPAVLIPRPETEHVVETALPLCAAGARVADAGCGSGAIAVTLALETAAGVWATDISLEALALAGENARRLGARVHFLACDLLTALPAASMDVVVSNPPYVPDGDAGGLSREIREHEPAVALFAGPAGTEIYRRLAEQAPRVLKPGGWIVLELGFKMAAAVEALFTGPWTEARATPDLAGFPRVFCARFAP